MSPASELDGSYSWHIAFIYVFNLIVGAGALTLPKAFADTGWILGTIFLAILGLMSYCTSTFMIEAMSMGNAVLRMKSMQKTSTAEKGTSQDVDFKNQLRRDATEDDSTSNNSDEIMIQPSDQTPISLSPDTLGITDSDSYSEDDFYDITTKVEMGQLANMFFNKAGLVLYYIVIALYLFGDLAIYAAAVPKSLATVICGGDDIFSSVNHTCSNVPSVSVLNMYRMMLVVFVATLCPFIFFNLAKTKFLQVATTVFRWLAFILMVVLALVRIGKGEGTHRANLFQIKNLPNFFGVAVYSFMCQHSLPSIITPVKNKNRINLVVFADFLLVAIFYFLLLITAVFSFDTLDDLYTLNFKTPMFAKYFLDLFPVFTLSTNFPIIGITLRENLKTLFLKPDRHYGLFVRRYLFPLVTIIPPIAVAYITYDVEFLVSVTGSYAGAVIQYVIPVMLVFYGRLYLKKTLGRYSNKYRSPFRQRSWIFMVIVWYFICFVFVTVNHFL